MLPVWLLASVPSMTPLAGEAAADSAHAVLEPMIERRCTNDSRPLDAVAEVAMESKLPRFLAVCDVADGSGPSTTTPSPLPPPPCSWRVPPVVAAQRTQRA